MLRFEPLNAVNFRFRYFKKNDLKLKQLDTLEKTFFLKFDILNEFLRHQYCFVLTIFFVAMFCSTQKGKNRKNVILK